MVRTLVFNGTDPGTHRLPYGAEALTDLGYSLTAAPRSAWLPRKVRDVVHHRWGLRIDRTGWRQARKADLVLAYLEPNIAYPAAMKAVPLSPFRRIPLVALFCWAAEDLETGTESQRRRVLRMLMASDLVAFFSRNQAPVLAEHGVPPERLLAVPFGVDTSPVPAPDSGRDIDLLAVGWDRGRDYVTLAEAVRGTGLRVDLVTDERHLEQLDLPPEVVVRGTVPRQEYLQLLTRAWTVVVPTHELLYPTGQSVALEGASAGCAVVVTDTPAMRDYFADGLTALMPPPADPGALRHALRTVSDDEERRHRLARAGQEHVHRRHATSHLWRAVAAGVADRGLVPDRA